MARSGGSRDEAAAVDKQEPSTGDGVTLIAKYRALTAKYQALVSKHAGEARHHAYALSLAWHALESLESGSVLVGRRGVLLCNARFHLLARPGGHVVGRYTAIDQPEGPGWSTLRGLILAEARTLPRGHEPVLRRYLQQGSDDEARVLSVRYEVLRARSERAEAPGTQPDKAVVGFDVPLVLALITDVTDQVRAEREVEEARLRAQRDERMRTLGEVASGVAHDLNNSLHAMRLRLSLLGDGLDGRRAEQAALLAQVIDDAAMMVGQLQDSAGQRHDRPMESVDLEEVVRSAVTLARSEVEQGGAVVASAQAVQIEQSLAGLPRVLGVPGELRRLFLNLLINARDAMAEGGVVRIAGRAEGERVIVTVDDEGGGIKPENLQRIFDPFFTTKGRKGTGLGLSMAWGVMNRLGGSIAAGNRAGGGARFSLEFPRAPEVVPEPLPQAAQQQQQQQQATVSPPRPAKASRRILLVDDDEDNVFAAAELLGGDGRIVDTAASGEEVVGKLERGGRWDVVFCDLGMPGLNGWEVAERIKRQVPEARIYLLTGWAHQIPRDDPRRGTVDGVIGKPIDVDRMRQLAAGA